VILRLRGREGQESMDQMMGNLFSRGQSIDVIRELCYTEMRYWNEWHKVMAKREDRAAQQLQNASKGK
jgi:hypothetical protein